jgi:F-box domain
MSNNPFQSDKNSPLNHSVLPQSSYPNSPQYNQPLPVNNLIQSILELKPNDLITIYALLNNALKCDIIRLLPVELSHEILAMLDLSSLLRCSLVSKNWRFLTFGRDADLSLWKGKVLNEFGIEGYFT